MKTLITVSAVLMAVFQFSCTKHQGTDPVVIKDIPRNGLIAFYPFTGDASDSSGHGYDLMVYPEGTTLTADRYGNVNHAYAFAGGNAHLYSSDPTMPAVPAPFTLSAWIKYDTLNVESTIMAWYSLGKGFIVRVNQDGFMSAFFDNTTVSGTKKILPSGASGQWIFLAITYDHSTLSFYKNGSLADTVSYSGPLSTATEGFRVSLSGIIDVNSALAFKCLMDDVAIYNRVLGASEIKQLYEQNITKN